MTDPIQIKHYKEDITSFNQLYKEFQRRFVRFANTYVRDLRVSGFSWLVSFLLSV